MALLINWRFRSLLAFCLSMAFLLGSGAPPSWSQSVSEAEAKAVFLYNFTQFVAWPANAVSKNLSPFVIGILGEDPFGTVLDQIVKGEAVKGRKIVVERYANLANVNDCEILFISRSEERHLDEVFAALKDKPVLTVGDIQQFAKRGGAINLITERNKIRILINLATAQRNRLVFSSNLLRVAEVVGGQ
jgi:hypothetical protein